MFGIFSSKILEFRDLQNLRNSRIAITTSEHPRKSVQGVEPSDTGERRPKPVLRVECCSRHFVGPRKASGHGRVDG